MEWKDKKEVKKGTIGEYIVTQHLLKQGLTVYAPISDGPHGFDRLTSVRKSNLVIVEVKTKAKRNYMPDTGINYAQYEEYKKISKEHKLPVMLYFVDEMLEQIYGDYLSNLEIIRPFFVNGNKITYPKVETSHGIEIIYFYQPTMPILVKNLRLEYAKYLDEIKKNNTRSYQYVRQLELF